MQSAFSFSLRLLRNGKLAELDRQKAGPDMPDPDNKDKRIPADQTLIESVKTFVKGEIALMPEHFNGVLVVATGSVNRDSGNSRCEIMVIGETIHE